MAFVDAMSSPDLTKRGVNGADVYTEEGVGDYRLALFTMLNRGLEGSYIHELVDKIFAKESDEMEEDLFVMAFQTRDIRGGKGEKRLFYEFINVLHTHRPTIVEKMIRLIPEYGCWRDMWSLNNSKLEDVILSYTVESLKDDIRKLDAGKTNTLSLLGKWLPREGSKYSRWAEKIAYKFCKNCGHHSHRMAKYRKEIARLNRALKTVEINMCGGNWADIKPSTVPGRNMRLHARAFFNQKLKSGGARYPDNKDRETCRENFEEFMAALRNGEKTVKGADVVMPHELASKVAYCSEEEAAIIQGQWESIRNKAISLGGLGKCVPMCDFSGSMSGTPKEVSMALGVLISEINHNAFRDHILTFDAEPKWHSFTGMTTLREKVNSIDGFIGHGLNTDFYKACMRILDKMVENKVPVGEEPDDLIVLTDMGWDDASGTAAKTNALKRGSWDLQVEVIRNKFKGMGESIWGEGNGWKMPRIVIWNLRGEYNDFQASASTEGVLMISGWSPSMLKVLQQGGVNCMTPYQGLREILDDERYDPVRDLWKICSGYEQRMSRQ